MLNGECRHNIGKGRVRSARLHPFRYCFVFFLAVGSFSFLCGCAKTESYVGIENYGEARQEYLPVNAGSEPLSAEEQQVDAKLAGLKREADGLDYGEGSYGAIDRDDVAYLNSGLYDFCRSLPKGGDLHVHDDTMIPVDEFVETIRDSAMISLKNDDTYGCLYAANNPDLPSDAVLLDDALENGSLTEDELYEILTLSEKDEEGGLWVNFEKLFSVTNGLLTDESLMSRIFERGFRSCCERGILYVEIRVFCVTDDAVNLKNGEMIRDAYYRVRKDYPDFTVRLIGCSGKNAYFTKEDACNTLNSVIRISKELKDEFHAEDPQDFVIGLDLVNEEDASKPLSDYADYFLSEEVQNSGLKLFLHCGESLREDNTSVIDAYMLGAERAGHGFNLYRFPELMEKYIEKGVALEVCPISNYRLGYVEDLRLHPALTYLRNGVPVIICSDDGLYLSESPLVDDFYAAILCWDLSLGDVKALCKNSITYSGLTDQEKNRLMQAWEAQWDRFIQEQSS